MIWWRGHGGLVLLSVGVCDVLSMLVAEHLFEWYQGRDDHVLAVGMFIAAAVTAAVKKRLQEGSSFMSIPVQAWPMLLVAIGLRVLIFA